MLEKDIYTLCITKAFVDCLLKLPFSHVFILSIGRPPGMQAELWAEKGSTGDQVQFKTLLCDLEGHGLQGIWGEHFSEVFPGAYILREWEHRGK